MGLLVRKINALSVITNMSSLKGLFDKLSPFRDDISVNDNHHFLFEPMSPVGTAFSNKTLGVNSNYDPIN